MDGDAKDSVDGRFGAERPIVAVQLPEANRNYWAFLVESPERHADNKYLDLSNC
jgi:hypothetical protein